MVKRRHPTPSVTEPEEPFLARWSRRKTQARSGIVDAEPELASTAPAPVDRPEPAPNITDADLPPLESLHEDSDFSAFLSPGVSDALRQRALRMLFSSAKFQIRDGLDDYDEDYRNFESLGKTITASMRHRARLEAERLVRADTEQPPADVAAEAQPITEADAGDGGAPDRGADGARG